MVIIQLSAELMLYALIGVYLQKRKIVENDFERQLSSLLLEVVLPVMIVRSMQVTLTAEDIQNCALLLVLCAGWMVFCALFGHILWYILGRGATGRIFRFSCMFTNFTFIGLPVMSCTYSQQTVFYFTVYLIPIRIALYTFCERLMTPPDQNSRPQSASLRTKLSSPPLLAMAAGLLLCLLGIRIPGLLDTVTQNISAMSLPLGMVVCGLIVGKFSLTQILSPAALLMTLIRNFLLPGLLLIFCRICALPSVITQCAVICAALPSATLVATFASKYDGSTQARYTSTGVVIFSHLFAVVTIPLWIWILSVVE